MKKNGATFLAYMIYSFGSNIGYHLRVGRLTFEDTAVEIGNNIGNGLVTLIDEKTKYTDFFDNN